MYSDTFPYKVISVSGCFERNGNELFSSQGSSKVIRTGFCSDFALFHVFCSVTDNFIIKV